MKHPEDIKLGPEIVLERAFCFCKRALRWASKHKRVPQVCQPLCQITCTAKRDHNNGYYLELEQASDFTQKDKVSIEICVEFCKNLPDYIYSVAPLCHQGTFSKMAGRYFPNFPRYFFWVKEAGMFFIIGSSKPAF